MANHTDLREFQQSLSKQMQASGDVRQVSTLGVSIAGQNWLVDMADISEVLPVQAMTAVPLSKAWVKGITNVRGNLYCVADIADYFKLGRALGNPDNRLLLTAGQYAFNAAFVVDKVLGLRDTRAWHQDQFQYIDEQNGVWHKLDIENLLVQPDFLQIGV